MHYINDWVFDPIFNKIANKKRKARELALRFMAAPVYALTLYLVWRLEHKLLSSSALLQRYNFYTIFELNTERQFSLNLIPQFFASRLNLDHKRYININFKLHLKPRFDALFAIEASVLLYLTVHAIKHGLKYSDYVSQRNHRAVIDTIPAEKLQALHLLIGKRPNGKLAYDADLANLKQAGINDETKQDLTLALRKILHSDASLQGFKRVFIIEKLNNRDLLVKAIKKHSTIDDLCITFLQDSSTSSLSTINQISRIITMRNNLTDNKRDFIAQSLAKI